VELPQLIDLKIIRKTVIWIKGNYCEVNTYNFLLAWDKRPATGGSQNSVPNLPPQEGEKNCGVKKELENQRKAIRLGFVTPGTDLWQKVSEEITRLERLVRSGG
jgi:hypothetical protein